LAAVASRWDELVAPQWTREKMKTTQFIDDFLATGSTLLALCQLVAESGATLAGIGCVVEKPQEEGRAVLREFSAPVITLAKVKFENEGLTVYE